MPRLRSILRLVFSWGMFYVLAAAYIAGALLAVLTGIYDRVVIGGAVAIGFLGFAAIVALLFWRDARGR